MGTSFESDAQFTKKTLPDETRTVETYMTSIGGTATLDAFYAKCRLQDRYNWDAKYTADAVNTVDSSWVLYFDH